MLRTRLLQVLALLVALSLLGLSPLAAEDHEPGNDNEEGGGNVIEGGPTTEADNDGPEVDRIAGPNRFVTAAALARKTFDDPEHVLLATSGQPVDALTGAPAAAVKDGPVLFTQPGRLHKEVEALLDEWDSVEQVTILGGPAAVGKQIERQLNALDIDVERLGGQNRYETAVAVSEWIERGGEPEDAAADPNDAGLGVSKITMLDQNSAHGDVVYLATSGRFADALSGAPLVAANNGSILLTKVNELPEATARRLEALAPHVSDVVALGGPSAVSDDVLDEAAALAEADGDRIFGADRYETAVEVSKELVEHGPVELAYVASGVGWADAVAGAAAAASGGAPLLLVRPNDVPEPVADELARLYPDLTWVLGGPAAITSRLEAALQEILDAADEPESPSPEAIEAIGENGLGD